MVIPKTPNADINVRANYWVIDPVLDRFDSEVKYAEKIDLNMADFIIQELGGVEESAHKCAPLTRKQMISPSDLRARLTAERKLIAQGKINIGTAAFTNQIIAALDEVLLVWPDETKRTQSINKLRAQLKQPQALSGFFDSGMEFLNNPLLQAGISFIPGGSAVAAGLNLLPQAGKSGGLSAKQGTAKTIWFWKYMPGGPRYRMPVIAETDSQSYRETQWRPLQERESGGIPLEQMESMFETAMQIDPGFVDKAEYKNLPTFPAKWQYIQKIANSGNGGSGLTSNKMLLWGGLGLLGLAAIATTVVVIKKRNKNRNGNNK